MAGHSTWARHQAKQCKPECHYCQHPPVVTQPVRSKNSRMSYVEISKLCVTLGKKLEQYEPLQKISR